MATGNGAITLAVEKLGAFLIDEAYFLLGVNADVEKIKSDLMWMQAFLADAEKKQSTDERIRLWMDEIRSIALETVTIIDAFSKETKGKKPSKWKLLTTSLQKLFCMAGKANIYNIGQELKSLNARLDDIIRKRQIYGIKNISNDVQETSNAASVQDRLLELRRNISSPDGEEYFVGLADDVKLLEAQLVLPDKMRSVISILGAGGLGKTSLAKKLYHTNKAKFTLHAWVCVSQEWKAKDLFERIIKSLLKEPTYQDLKILEKMKDDDVKGYLRNLLKDKMYLVVIDDLWDEGAWAYLRSALPDYLNGSRVIITTRYESVAGLSDQRTYVHKLRRLRVDESWELFCQKAFSGQKGACPKDLEEEGKKMVAQCDGLPLAIIVLGGILSRKQSYEWHVIKNHIKRALSDNSIHISALLDLGYNDLTRELKSCFLYMGIFPEDYEIRCDKLVQLWIAEGLIKQPQEGDLEELAEYYINELNSRNLIQLHSSKYGSDSTCRVDDLLRDLAVKKAKALEFYHIYEESMNPPNDSSSIKRIAFRSGFDKYIAGKQIYPQVHTLSFLNFRSLLDDDEVTTLLTLINTKFEFLRVLDLEGVKIATSKSKSKLFKAMEKMVYLRYLGLFETNIDELPKSIGNLQGLQAMDMSSTMTCGRILLPKDMCKLKELRHLSGFFGTKRGDSITLLKDLTNLHCLDTVDISGWLRNEKSDEFALNAFSKLRNVRNLSVLFQDANYSLSIEPLFSCRNLLKLTLKGSIKSLPVELHKSLPDLRYLSLHGANLVQDPLQALEKLPNLLELYLDGCLKLKSLIITATGFFRLVRLSILDIPVDMILKIEETALPCLEHIQIDPSMKFTLPERFTLLSW